MKSYELTCKTCRLSVPFLLLLQHRETRFLRRSGGCQGLHVWRLVGDEWEASHPKGNLGCLKYQAHRLRRRDLLHHPN